MKKLVGILAGILAVMLIALCGCSTNKIPERPEDTNLEFWIAEDVSEINWQEYETSNGGYGFQEYYGKGYEVERDSEGKKVEPEYYVKYHITSWPDYSYPNSCVTGIYITDPSVTVYGLTVNSTKEEFDKVFQGKGYKLSEWENSPRAIYMWCATKNGFQFSIEEKIDGEPIRMFRVNATVTNQYNIKF